MSLNDDTYKELGTDLKNEPILDLGMGKPAVANTVVTTPNVQNVETPVTPEVLAKLQDPATKFKSIQDGIEKTTSMEEMLASVDVKKAISFADAEDISMLFESFSTKIPLSGFTKAPSKIGLVDAKTFMAKQIKARHEELGTELDIFLTAPNADQEESFRDYRNFYGVALQEDLEKLKDAALNFLSSKQSNHQTFDGGNGLTINLFSDDVATLPQKYPLFQDSEPLEAAICNLQDLLENNMHLRTFLYVANFGEKFEDFLSEETREKAKEYVVSMSYILKSFASAKVWEFIHHLEEGAEKAIEELNDIRDSAKVDVADFRQVRDFVVKNGKEIDEANSWVHYYIELTDLVRNLFLNTSVVLDYMKIE